MQEQRLPRAAEIAEKLKLFSKSESGMFVFFFMESEVFEIKKVLLKLR